MIKEIKLPEISENVQSGDVISILVAVGDIVEEQQSIIELETDKATFDMPSPIAGKVTEIDVTPNQNVKVGQVVLKLDTETTTQELEKEINIGAVEQTTPEIEPQAVVKIEQAIEIIEEKSQPTKPAVLAAPATRQLAHELGIDINQVPGSCPAGGISLDDVKKYAKTKIIGKAIAPAETLTKQLPDFTKFGDIERKPFTITRKKIAETLSYAWSNVPHVTQYDKADITDLQKFRDQYSQKVQEAGGKLTLTSILLKVVASALQVFPEFNSSVDAASEEIILKKYINIGVAVDTDRGLLVPVIREIDKKNILQLSIALTEISERTRNKKITSEEMTGGNFTISNLGGIGGSNFSPIIYWPQVAILGVSRAYEEPVGKDGPWQVRSILPLSLSYDHRIIDGSDGTRFLRWIVRALEQPFLLAMQE